MQYTLFLVIATAFADASLAIKRDETSSTPAINVASSTSTSESSPSETYGLDPSEFCFPRNATGHRDFNAPCNLIAAIQAQCSYGPRALDFITLPFDREETEWPDFSDPEWEQLSPDAQRVCYCQSQYTDATIGCQECHLSALGREIDNSRGLVGYDSWQDLARGLMAQYCDVDFKPEKNFAETYKELTMDVINEDGYESKSAGSSTSGSDATSVNTSTDVSAYYTMSVEGSSAYDLAMPTPESSGGQVTYTTSSVSDGRIVPTTAAAQAEASGDDDSSTGSSSEAASATSSADSGSATAYAGGVGMFAMLGMVAAL